LPREVLLGEPANNEALANSMGLFCFSVLGREARIPPTEQGGKATNVLRQESEGEVTQGDAVSTVVTESSSGSRIVVRELNG
jgi:hypothetical protein